MFLSKEALSQKKRLDVLLTCHCIVAVVAGSFALALPHLFGFFFGEEWHGAMRFNPSDGQVKITHVVIRLYGALIVGQAFIVWHIRDSPDGNVRKGIVRAYFVAFSLTALVLLRSHFTDAHWHWYNWANISLFSFLAAFYGWFCFCSPPPVFEGLDAVSK